MAISATEIAKSDGFRQSLLNLIFVMESQKALDKKLHEIEQVEQILAEQRLSEDCKASLK